MYINVRTKLCIDKMLILCIQITMILPVKYWFLYLKTIIYAQSCEKQ